MEIKLGTLRSYLIKPYNELKTEEEREEYINKLENKRTEKITREQFMEIMEIVEEIDRNNIPTYLQNARKIKEWMEENETTRQPRSKGKDATEEEKKLGRALNGIRSNLINPYKVLKTEEREEYINKLENKKTGKLTREQFMEIMNIIEEIDRNKNRNKVSVSLRNARKIKEWMKKNETTRPPRSNGKDATEEERRLGEALATIRKGLIKPYSELKTEEEREEYVNKLENRQQEPITREEFMEIINIIEEIDENNVPVRLQQARKIKEWMEKNGTTRPPRHDGKDATEEEQDLGTKLANIRCRLIKPYNELKTEEEREGYICELENRRRESITREQFMEILDIVEEIDRKRQNLTELVEQSKATQEKVEEAKKLESMYEQELNGKEQKESSDMGDDSK